MSNYEHASRSPMSQGIGIRLAPNDLAALQRIADQRAIPVAQVAREAIRRYVHEAIQAGGQPWASATRV